jgi:signal transduction histidine kinase
MPTLGLRGKLIAGSVGLVLTFLTAGIAVLSHLIESYADRQIAVELAGAQLSSVSHLRLQRSVLRERATHLAQLPSLRATVGTDRTTIDDFFDDLLGVGPRDLLLLLGARGEILGGTQGVRAAIAETPGPAFPPDLAASEKLFFLGDRLYEGIAAPVRDGEVALATLVLAQPIDDMTAAAISTATGHDAVIVCGGRVFGEATAQGGRGLLVRDEEGAALLDLERRYSAGCERVAIAIGGSARQAVVCPLHPEGGVLVLSRVPDQILGLQRSARLTLLTVALIVGALAVLLCSRVASRLARPLAALTRATETMAAGNLEVRVDAEGNDEVARLGAAFNGMTSTIHGLVADVRRQAELATAANRAKDGFLASVSHELRTPATNVRAYAEILRDYGEGTPPEERLSFLEIILSQAARLESLIANVIDYCAMESGQVAWQMAPVDFAEIVREACAAANEDDRDVAIEMHLPASAPCLGDRARLLQMTRHLLDNAITYSPVRGAVAVELRIEGGTLALHVRDCGAGIPDSAKAKIFERFVQLGDELTQKPAGLGLGLTFVQFIAVAHGGTVHCQDAEGGGAEFIVRLPMLVPAPLRPEGGARAESGEPRELLEAARADGGR